MFGNLTGWHLIIVLVIVLLLFGAPKLPGLARSIGQSMRIFRSEVKTMKDENGNDVDPDAPSAGQTPSGQSSSGSTPSNPAPPKP